jgi:hypothetical protein
MTIFLVHSGALAIRLSQYDLDIFARESLTDDGTAADAAMRVMVRISIAQGDKTQETKSNRPKGDARKSRHHS